MSDSDIFRPNTFKKYIGQDRAKFIISDVLHSAAVRQVPIEHMLFTSEGPGLGKTTIVRIIADMWRTELIEITASSLETPRDIIMIFKRLNRTFNSILFIDEIHNLKSSIGEMLYSPMEDYGGLLNTKIVVGDGREEIMNILPFTIIGATAGEEGKLPQPLLDRFLTIKLVSYNNDEILQIIRNVSSKVSIDFTEAALKEIVLRSHLTPRIANSFVRRMRDYAISRDKKAITDEDAIIVFSKLGIDELGLDDVARNILKCLHTTHRKRLGLKSLATLTRIDIKTLRELYEPKLMRAGLMDLLPNGRALTLKGEEYIEQYIGG